MAHNNHCITSFLVRKAKIGFKASAWNVTKGLSAKHESKYAIKTHWEDNLSNKASPRFLHQDYNFSIYNSSQLGSFRK